MQKTLKEENQSLITAVSKEGQKVCNFSLVLCEISLQFSIFIIKRWFRRECSYMQIKGKTCNAVAQKEI